MAHTPGPWEMKDKGYGYDIGPGIAWIGDTTARPKKEQKANAHLIACAPELLEALEDLERTAGIPAMSDDPVRVRARAVLAKAKEVE